MQLVDLNDINYIGHNILVFGAPGVGKTRFIGTAAERLYTFVMDVDDGNKTLRYMDPKVKDNLVVARMSSFSDLDAVYKLCLKNDPTAWEHFLNIGIMDEAKKIKIKKPFEAIAIDTWSELQYVMVDEIRPGSSLLAMQDIKKMQSLEIQHWGKVMDLTKTAIRAFKDLPITFIASFHEQLLKDDLSGGVYGLPALQGKIAYDVGKYFDIMAHMTMTQDSKYALSTKGHKNWQAKSRIPCDPIILDPTFTKLFASLQNKI